MRVRSSGTKRPSAARHSLISGMTKGLSPALCAAACHAVATMASRNDNLSMFFIKLKVVLNKLKSSLILLNAGLIFFNIRHAAERMRGLADPLFADGGGRNRAKSELQSAAVGRRRTARFCEPQYSHAACGPYQYTAMRSTTSGPRASVKRTRTADVSAPPRGTMRL